MLESPNQTFHFSLSLSLSLSLSFFRPFSNNEVYLRHVFGPRGPRRNGETSKKKKEEKKEKKKEIPSQSHPSPILSNLYPIQGLGDAAIGQMPLPGHASMIKLNNIYATRVQCIRSVVLDFRRAFYRVRTFSLFLCGGDRLVWIKTRTKSGSKRNGGYRASNDI